MPINCFIPSKDRSCQLHLLLQSLQKNAPGLFSPEVMFCTSNNDFYEGYMECFNRFPSVRFHQEVNAEKSFYEFLNRNKRAIIGLFTDDSIFYRPAEFTENDIKYKILSEEDVWAFHTRLGKNITITDYVTNKPCPQPSDYEIVNNKFMKWSYRNAPCSKFDSYFYFPSPFDGSFYWAEDLLFLANNCHFEKIILWEHEICNNQMQDKTSKDKLVCPLLSNVVVQNINSSHTYGHRTSNTFIKSLPELNEKYLAGQIIDLDSMDFSMVNCAHAEIPFTFREM